MRMYTVSLPNDKKSLSINFRGSVVVLKEGDTYSGDSPIYKFYSKYFVPSIYYNKIVEKEIIEELSTNIVKEVKKTSIDDFSENININENDVIIEITNQEKEI